jgi:hypothetical protein
MRFRVFSLIVGGAAGLLLPALALADDISWNGGNGNWNVPGNWDKNKVPDAGDNAFITAPGTYTVTLDANAEVASLTLGGASGTQTLSNASRTLTLDGASTVSANGVYSQSNGTLAGAGALTVNGTVNWSAGAFNGPGSITITAPGTLNIATNSTKTLTRSITNAGTTTWTDSSINSGQGAVFTNQNGGMLLIQGDDFWSFNLGGATSQLVNQQGGVITKSITGGTTTLSLPFTNAGGVTLSTGILALSKGGSNTGTFSLATGTRLEIPADTYTLNAGTTFTGTGAVRTSSSGTLSVAADVTVINLEQTNGTVTGAANLTISTSYMWSAGTLSGTGATIIPMGSVLNITTTSTKSLTRSINNAGTTNWTDSNINSGQGAVFTNQNGGMLLIQGDDFWSFNLGGATSQLVNQQGGVITKSITGGTTTLSLPFTNAGGVTLSTGILALSKGGSNTGTFSLATGTRLEIPADTYTLNAGTTFTGTGAVRTSSGGTLSVAADVTVINLEQTNGTVTGAANLTISTSYMWSAGTLSGTGTTVIPMGSVLNITTNSTKSLTRSINNAGTTTWTDSSINSGQGAVFTNQNGGMLLIQGDDTWSFNLGGATSQVVNLLGGVITKSITGGTTTLTLPFTNAGSVTLSTGILALNKGGSNTGTFNLATGTQLGIPGDTYTLNAGTTFTGMGSVRVSSGGTLSVAADVTVINLEQTNGTVTGAANLTISTSYVWSAGTLSGTGTTVIPMGSVLNITTNSTKSLTRSINSAGTTNWTASNINSGQGAVFTNQAGAMLNIQSDQFWSFNLSGATSQLVNQAGGTVTKSVTGGTTTFSNLPVTNSGTLNATSGTLTFNGTFTQTAGVTHLAGGNLATSSTIDIQGGILDGTGTITGNVSNGGQVNPGTSPGTITVNGSSKKYTQTAQGILNIEINGLAAGSEYDQIDLTGMAMLAGTLQVSLGFTPTIGSTFTIINNDAADAVSGTFTGLPEGAMFMANGSQFQISYVGGSGNDVVLTFMGGAAVTSTPTATATQTSTPTPVTTATITATTTPTEISTGTPTPTGTGAPTATATSTASATPTVTQTPTATGTANASTTETTTATQTPTAVVTLTPTTTATTTPTTMATPSATPSATASQTATTSPTPTVTPTGTMAPQIALVGFVLSPGRGGAPGTHGQVPLGGVQVDLFLCELRQPCQAVGDPVATTFTEPVGRFVIRVAAALLQNKVRIVAARISPTVVLRAPVVAFPVTGGSARQVGEPTDTVIDVISEAALQLLDEQGLENFNNEGIGAVLQAVQAANTDANFEDDADMVEAAVNQAQTTAANDPAVQAAIEENLLPPVCVGDCDGDGEVSVAELITGVNITLGTESLEICPAFDPDGDGTVTITDLVTAVNNALLGCPK